MSDDSLREYFNTLIQSAKDREVNLKEEKVSVKFQLKSKVSPRSQFHRRQNYNGEPLIRILIVGDQRHCEEAVTFHMPYVYFDSEGLENLHHNLLLIDQLVDTFDAFLVSDTILEQVSGSFGPLLNEAYKSLGVLTHDTCLSQKAEEVKLKIQEDLKKEQYVTVEIGDVGMTPEKLQDNLHLAVNSKIPDFKKTWLNVKVFSIATSTGPVIPMDWIL